MNSEDAIKCFEWLSVKAEQRAADFERRFPGYKSELRNDKELFSMAISALRAQAEAEKNEPLTVAELREMDGEPVWVEMPFGYKFYNGWTLVNVDWKSNNVIYLVRFSGRFELCEELIKSGGKIYRRKPEEDNDA